HKSLPRRSWLMTWPAKAGSVRTGAGDRSNALDPEFREFDLSRPCGPSGCRHRGARWIHRAGLGGRVGRGLQATGNPKAVRRHTADDLDAPAHIIPKVGAGQAVDLAVLLLGQRVFARGRFAALDAPGQRDRFG